MNGISYLLRRVVVAVRGELGAVATEYGLILTLVALVIILGVSLFGTSLLGLFQRAPAEFP